MTRLMRTLLLSTVLAGPVRAADTDEDVAQEVVITGSATPSSATGLGLTPAETPQSVTIVDAQRIRDFAITNVNDLLAQVPGINVERVETDRIYFNSRGFDITNFQVDGIGLPLISGIQFGDIDTVLWDRVEAVRGANGMMTGVGNPSATIDYVRKRPTATFQAHAAAMYGSWDDWRVEGDVSGPLTASGKLEARVISAHEERNSYLDFNRNNRDVVAGLLAWKVTPDLTATVGYSRQQNDADGVLWGALPLLYSDGTQIRAYPRSASTAQPWTYWDTRDQTAFGELAADLGSGWTARGIFTYRQLKYQARLLYAFGYPDKGTGLGITGSTGTYPSNYKQYLYDAYASGPLELFGRKHELAFGASYGRSHGREYEGFSSDLFDYPAVGQIGGVIFPVATYPEPTLQADLTDRLFRAYAAAHLNFADRLKGVVGASYARLKGSGTSYGVDESRNDDAVTPYVGLLYDLTSNLTAYASYTGIFNPQSEVDASNRKLDPAKGSSIEAGLKTSWFGKKLYATAAIFRARQKGLASFAGSFGPGDAGPLGGSYYAPIDTTSKGFELELTGRVTDRWTLSGGYTGFRLKGEGGGNPRPYIPNRTLKLATTYTIPELRDLKLGAEMRWQNGIYYTDAGVQDAAGKNGVVRQRAYAVVDLTAGIRLVDHLRAQLNLRNVTDRKYLASLMWGQAFYAAPRSASVSLSVDW